MAGALRPKLMFVLGLAPTKIGGIEKFLGGFVLAMDRAGWDTVLCFDGPVGEVFRGSVDYPFCTIEALPKQGDLGFAAAGTLWKLLRKHHPQRFLYAFHGIMRCFPWLAKLSGAKFISFYDHSSRAPGFQAAPLSLPKRVVGRILTAPLDLIVSVSDFTRSTGTALGLSSARNVVVVNGVDLPTPEPTRGKILRSRLSISENALVITQLCWMVPVKGVQTLLDAARLVLQQAPETHFLLVGDGPQLPEYRQHASDLGIAGRVTFTGVISNPTENGVFEASDMYCQASLWQEASGLAVMEAMSFRLPVVASRIGGLPENVVEGNTGLLFAAGNAAELAGCLLSLVRDPELRRRMGEAGSSRIRERHTLQGTINRYVELILGQDSGELQ